MSERFEKHIMIVTPVDHQVMSFEGVVGTVKDRFGKTLLSDDDLAILTCEEIARTYTRDEKNYS